MSDLEEAQAIRYYLDAMCDMDTIGLALSRELYPVAIFFSQQVCEKCAKGCLALSGIMIAIFGLCNSLIYKLPKKIFSI